MRNSCRPRLRTYQTGFTLVELIVTMIIIGILAVSVAPRFSALSGYSELGFRDQIRATLEFARKSAVAQRRVVQVNIASTGLSLSIAAGTPETNPAGPFFPTLRLPGKSGNSLTAPPTVTMTATINGAAATLPTSLTFDALGRPSSSATLTVSTSGDVVTLEAETGHVH